ncbi:hypothetical protein ACJJI5_16180 [Microbulbifer sp. EKSA008]|uniref:hypothetical protein n=1 Tax=unclassified Microbulbifer TaxID=2619833 RepID=UPI004039C938
MENNLAHYGLDWLAISLSLYAAYLLGNKQKIGFIIFAISNVLWIILGIFFMSSYGMAIGNLAFFLINARGFNHWNTENVEKKVI